MKIKDLEQMIRENPTEQTVTEVAQLLFQEMQELMKTRDPKNLPSMKSAVKQINDKWEALVYRLRDIDIIKSGGFKAMLHHMFPELKTVFP